ncbi:hypothetical protein NHQ30_007908 [Ciborinia camelliae]|nr:hypothetical protein NHQ30_007908 [Ciborinia camelliae]
MTIYHFTEHLKEADRPRLQENMASQQPIITNGHHGRMQNDVHKLRSLLTDKFVLNDSEDDIPPPEGHPPYDYLQEHEGHAIYLPMTVQTFEAGPYGFDAGDKLKLEIERSRYLMVSAGPDSPLETVSELRPGDILDSIQYIISANLTLYIDIRDVIFAERQSPDNFVTTAMIMTSYTTPPIDILESTPNPRPGSRYRWDNISLDAVRSMLYAHGQILYDRDGHVRHIPIDDLEKETLLENVEELLRGDLGHTWRLGHNTIGVKME